MSTFTNLGEAAAAVTKLQGDLSEAATRIERAERQMAQYGKWAVQKDTELKQYQKELEDVTKRAARKDGLLVRKGISDIAKWGGE